ncbi:MAG: tripartite tricarboxylate transporter substrate binding protein [Betaproteobacteria bacterium]|nr:tripartite tricarboxylate transporter substrate binding protein [Betaproteobacteria bacterium]
MRPTLTDPLVTRSTLTGPHPADPTRRRLTRALAAPLALGLSRAAQAQDFPTRPMRLLVPIAAGGLTDSLARALASRLGERLGQPMVVENRPGAGGVIGMQAAARAPADGHSLVLVYQGVAAVNPSLLPNLPYDIGRDFVPVGGVGSFPFVVLVNPSVRARTATEFLEAARAASPPLAYASAGNATGSHLSTELLKRRARLDLVHVPYKGEAPALADLVGGAVPVALTSVTVALPMIRAGKVRALAVTSIERNRLLPEVPTLAEAALPEFESVSWYGVLAPAGTPAPALARLSRELAATLAEPELRGRLETLGIDPKPTGPEAFGRFLREETDRWRRLIAEAGIRAD